jgi:hypothetical protein
MQKSNEYCKPVGLCIDCTWPVRSIYTPIGWLW